MIALTWPRVGSRQAPASGLSISICLVIALLAPSALAEADPGHPVSASTNADLEALRSAHLEQPDDPPAQVAPAASAGDGLPSTFQRGPYISYQVNVGPAGQNIPGDAANEPSLAIDPTDPTRMAVGWRQFDSILSNFRQAGWGFSQDAGVTWTFPGRIETGFFRSDPVLGADADGNIYYNSLSGDFSCQSFKSINGGATWDGGVEAFGGDKQWIDIDQTSGMGRGHYYCAWSIFAGCCGNNAFIRSTDGGQTFSTPIAIPGTPIFGTVAVGPDGEVYVAGISPGNFASYLVAKSTTLKDASRPPAFESVTTVDMGGSIGLQGLINPAGLLGQVWIAVDHSDGDTRGNVYLFGSVDPLNADPLEVMFSRSTDGGATWTSPNCISDDDPDGNAWQWFGTMSIAPDGRIDAVWNDTRNSTSQASPTSELYYAYSFDAGDTWSVNIPVGIPFDQSLGYPQQNKLGDYYDMLSDESGASLAYAATYNNEQDVYFLKIGDCNTNGIHDAIDLMEGTSQDCNSNGIPDACDARGNDVPDCNNNAIPDSCDIAAGTSPDDDGNGVPDECEGKVLFVDAAADGPLFNGNSWESAYTDLQSSLAVAEQSSTIGEIWVAAGTYTPAGEGGPRESSFEMLAGISILGGFNGTETSLDQRDPEANSTILSGDLDQNDDAGTTTDNSYHVVVANGLNASAVLDGFIVQAGQAEGSFPDSAAGGIYIVDGNPTIRSCVVRENSAQIGGGVYVSAASPTFVDCSIEDNSSRTSGGGGMYALSSSPQLDSCTFSRNTTSGGGGGLYAIGSSASPELTNCLFTANHADTFGGGMYLFFGGTSTITNCTLVGNTADGDGGGGGLNVNGANPVHVRNCIAWFNSDSGDDLFLSQIVFSSLASTLDYSCVEGFSSGGVGNIGDDPSFLFADGGDYRIGVGSPCIDAGDNAAVGPSITTDLAGNARFFDDPATPDTGTGTPPIVDMGAYEGPAAAIVVSTMSVLDHGGVDLALDLMANSVEPRSPGIRDLLMTSSGPASEVSASVTCALHEYTGAVSLAIQPTPAAAEITVSFLPALPDADCCMIELTGDVEDVVVVRTLRGDIDRDGVVSTKDNAQIHGKFGSDPAIEGAALDFDTNGVISTGDASRIKALFGRSVPLCP